MEIQLKFVLKVKRPKMLLIFKKALVLINSLSELISKTNGGALIIDYGENHALSDSIRVINLRHNLQLFLKGNSKSQIYSTRSPP